MFRFKSRPPPPCDFSYTGELRLKPNWNHGIRVDHPDKQDLGPPGNRSRRRIIISKLHARPARNHARPAKGLSPEAPTLPPPAILALRNVGSIATHVTGPLSGVYRYSRVEDSGKYPRVFDSVMGETYDLSVLYCMWFLFLVTQVHAPH